LEWRPFINPKLQRSLEPEHQRRKREILKNEKYREEIKTTSKDYHEKEKHLSKETKELLAPPVQTQIKGHASAPYFGKEEPSVAPTSTGKTFQPGSWMPQDGKSHNQ
ncbi:PREDICTED: mimitin, mitochondrial-like, partial [Galeopterus variegatus]|uniref:Mimitin, mitochondrial-like n=1 Tax=Galeopterus variegatus TaxID=482537 RepID=A0ABM0R155_GALVR